MKGAGSKYDKYGNYIPKYKAKIGKDNKEEFSYQRRMGEFLNNEVPQDILDKKNKDKSWRYGYNEEYDIVIISKDGTLGQVYVLDNLRIGLPKEPEDKTKILGHDLPSREQRWKPFGIPKELLDIEREAIEWNSNKANKNNPKTPTEIFYAKPQHFTSKYIDLINDDFDRRKFGVWQYINGKAVYIVGSHYFMLQHIPVHGSTLPNFRFSNLDMYLFWEACKADSRSMGMIKVKGRREGASTMAGGETLNVGTQLEEGFLGIMSKTNRDSESFLMRMVVRPFKKLPWYLKPSTSGTTSARSGLIFKELIKKISSSNTVMSGDSGLDTSIKQFPTALNSMDGERVDFSVLDEAGKFPKDVPFDSYWSIMGTALTEGFKIIGKCMVISTVNAMSEGGEAFKNIYVASNINNRAESGRTTSGLYSFFMPACWTMEGGYDSYGYSVVDDPKYPVKGSDGELIKIGNWRRIDEEGKAKKKISDVLYNEHLRQYPLIISHAFRDEAQYSDFNLNKIYEQIDHNYLSGNEYRKRTDVEVGNFINVGKDGKYEIEWRPSPAGRFVLSWIPPENMRNNFEYRGGLYYPKSDYGCFGIDSYRIQKTADPKRGSLGAMNGVTGMTYNEEIIPSNMFFLEYLNRPSTINTFIDDMIFAMLFYGLPVLAERNVANFLEELKRRGMTHFSMRRRDLAKLSPDDKRLGGFHMNEDSAQKHYYALQTYIEKYVGIDDDGQYRDKGQMGTMVFTETLESWSKFRPDNRTTQDLSISSGLAIYGVNMMQTMNRTNSVSKVSVQQTQGLFKLYDYS